MSDLQRVLRWFDEGLIVRPRADQQPTIVDLITSIACVCGVEGIDQSPQVQRLVEQIGMHDHVVFVVIDGLGLQLLQDMDPAGTSFIREHEVRELQAVFPSTTAVALTSLGTAAYPARHGLSGWWMYLEELNITAEILPFVERFSKKTLLDFGVRHDLLFTVPSILPRFKRQTQIVTRGYISNSHYSRYWSGGAPSMGYERIAEGTDLVIQHVRRMTSPSYTHLYLPQLDGACHQHGVDHPSIRELFVLLDNEMRRLFKGCEGRVRLIISADHGHVNPRTDRHIQHNDRLTEFLKCAPTGDQNVPLFHVKNGRHGAFREEFSARFGDLFALLSIDEVEHLELLGPGRLSAAARRHFGDYMGVASAPHTIHYMHPHLKTHIHRGVHSGLTRGEMTVPLVLA